MRTTRGRSELTAAVVFDPAGFSPLAVADAARGWCRLLWVVGWLPAPDPYQRRLLSRLGKVVEVDGADVDMVAPGLAPHGVDGVIGFTDPAVRLATALADRLGCPANNPLTSAALTDKFLQREMLASAAVPVPAFAVVPASGDEPAALEAFPLPAVAKPRRGSDSRAATFLPDADALGRFLSSPRPEEFLVEAFLADRETPADALGAPFVSVESLVQRGDVSHVGVTGRFPLASPVRDRGGYFPADLPAAEAQEVMELATAAARALGVTDGALHTEIKLTPDGPRIIEVNGRVGGGVPGLVARAGGPDMLALALRVAVGRPMAIDATRAPKGVSFFWWVHGPGRLARVRDVRGLTELGDLPGVREVRLNLQPGDLVDPARGGSGHVVAVEGATGSHEELRRLLGRMEATVSIEWSADGALVAHVA
ncbi:MAG TPA: ATP-grasp domain-containing protein [Acidimicrobiales bacterium]|nr:ATP-grasp domain-containing protein [Acidimicrobiales bacterium]